MSRQQVWLRHDQVELVIACLKLSRTKMKDSCHNDVTRMTGQYVENRINEILELFEAAYHKFDKEPQG